MSHEEKYGKGSNYARGDTNPIKILPDRILEEVKRWVGLHIVGRRLTNHSGFCNSQ